MNRKRLELLTLLGCLAAAALCLLFVAAAFLQREGGLYVYVTFAALWAFLAALFLLSAWRVFRILRGKRPQDEDRSHHDS